MLALSYIFINLFSVSFSRQQLGSHICFCVLSVDIFLLFEVQEEILALHRYVMEKGNILVAFFR